MAKLYFVEKRVDFFDTSDIIMHINLIFAM